MPGDAELSMRFKRSGPLAPTPLDFIRTLWVLEAIAREGIWGAAWLDDGADMYAWEGRSFVEPPFYDLAVPPPLPPGLRLRVERLRMESPFELFSQIPGEFYAAGGAYAVAGILERIEKVWNMPARIRRERTEIERDTWIVKAERDRARDDYYRETARRAGFHLEEATLEIPDDWEWPDPD